jgi:hypothetical protein
LVLFSCASLFGQGKNSNTKLEKLPESLEVHWALSAAPPYLRAEATLYLLDPAKGYVLHHQGTNGFTCYVQRTDYQREDFSNTYFAPECQDAEGTKTIGRVEFDVERMRAEGKLTSQELKQAVLRGFKEGTYQAPTRPGIAYMLSPLARLYGPGSTQTTSMNMPHLMFFAPNLSGQDAGAGPPMGPYPYFINPGPMAYIIQNIGEAEKAKINNESQALLKEACDYRQDFCVQRTSTH